MLIRRPPVTGIHRRRPVRGPCAWAPTSPFRSMGRQFDPEFVPDRRQGSRPRELETGLGGRAVRSFSFPRVTRRGISGTHSKSL